MQIITDIEKLSSLTEEESKAIENNAKNGRLIVFNNSDRMPTSLLSLLVSYGERLIIKDFPFNEDLSNDKFSLGVLVGSLVSIDSDIEIILSNCPYVIGNSLTSFINSFKSVLLSEEKGKRGNKAVKGNSDVKSTKTRKPRTVKTTLPTEEEIMKSVEEKEEPLSEKKEVSPKSYEIISIFKGTATLELAEIMNDKKESARLVECVKKASDKNIGLPFLLQTYFGKEISEKILDEVQTKYDELQAL